MKTSLLSFAVLSACLSPLPTLSQTFQAEYNYYKREGFGFIVNACAQGRLFNSRELSYWDPRLVEGERRIFRQEGYSETRIVIALSAKATVMKEQCPTVW